MRAFRTLIAMGGLLAAGVGWTQAQNPGADQADALRLRRETEEFLRLGKPVPELYPGETRDLGPQIPFRGARRDHFELILDSQYLYTSNMFFEEDSTNPEETSLMVNTVQLAMAPDPYELGPGTLAPRVGYRHQWYLYGLEESAGRLNDFNFNSQALFSDFRYRLSERWLFDAGLEYNRLLLTADYDEFYRELVPHAGVRFSHALQDQWTLMAACVTAYRFTKSDIPGDSNDLDRLDQSLLLAVTHEWTPTLFAQPFYRVQLSRFTHLDREDLIHSLGVAVGWEPRRWFHMRAFLVYDVRHSTGRAVPDYEKFDAGAGLQFSFRF